MLEHSTLFPDKKCACPQSQSTGRHHGVSQTLQLLRNKSPLFQLLGNMFPKFRKHAANYFL